MLTAAGLLRRFPAARLRGAGWGSPPRRVSVVRCHRRCRLRGGHHALLGRVRQLRLHDRRGRGHLLGPMPGVCRGNFCRVRRLIADAERSTLEEHGLGSKAANVKGNQPSEGDSETGGGPRCLTRRMRRRASVKARTQQFLSRLLRRPGPGRTGIGGRISRTSLFLTSTRLGPIRWGRTSTMQRSSRPSTSMR
jgi:hypothetical protein